MLDWLAAHSDLLIALFGAGGAGAVLLTTLLNRKKGGGGQAPEKSGGGDVHATASGGAVAAAHGGQGNISVSVNERVDGKFIADVERRLGLSLSEAAALLRAFEAARFDLARCSDAVDRIEQDAGRRDALVSALRERDDARVSKIIACMAGDVGAAPGRG